MKDSDISLPLFVIGAGSNLLIKDGLIKKFFIHLKARDFNKIEINRTIVVVGAGVRLSRMVSVLGSKDIGGYEFLAGIPGTIGGACVMNAGAKTDLNSEASMREMKDIIREVEVLDPRGNITRLKKKDLNFSYRNSSLKPYIIISATLRLQKADKNGVRKRVKEIIRHRAKKQDWQHPNAGSFFKNPEIGDSAGRLIDLCHLKGARVGDAQVSEKHANFIINRKRAKCADVVKLVNRVKREVYGQFKIELIPEVEIVS